MMRHLLQLHDRNSSVNREDLETNFEAGVSTQPPQWAGPKPDDILFRTCVTQYFCGQGRSTSPFRKQLVMKFDLDIFFAMYTILNHKRPFANFNFPVRFFYDISWNFCITVGSFFFRWGQWG